MSFIKLMLLFLYMFLANLFGLAGSAVIVSTFDQLESAITSKAPEIIISSSIAFETDIFIPSNSVISVSGVAGSVIALSASANARLFSLNASTTSFALTGLTLNGPASGTSSFAGNGGLIFVQSASLSIANSTISDSTSSCGCIYTINGTISISNSQGTNCIASAKSGCGGFITASGSSLNITDSTFTANQASEGGVITAKMTELHITQSSFADNIASAGNGGALQLTRCTGQVDNTIFTSNLALSNGGSLSATSSSLLINNLTFNFNNATNYGGSVYFISSTVTIFNSQLSLSRSLNSGGAMYIDGGTLTVIASSIIENYSMTFGGAFFCSNNGILTVTDSTFTDNGATSGGGAISIDKCLFSTDNVQFIDNYVILSGSATAYGGSISCLYSTMNIVQSSFLNSFAGQGGAIYAFSCTDVLSSIIVQGTVAEDSAIVSSVDSSLTIFNSTFVNNTGTLATSCIECTGATSCTLYSSTFVNNTAFELGVFYAESTDTVIVSDCVFLNNFATGQSGAIYIKSSANVIVSNSIFEDNIAATYGGAISADLRTKMMITNSSFIHNTATSGGALYIFDFSEVSLTNCSLIGNTAADAGGSIYIGDHSIVNVTYCNFTSNTAPYGGAVYLSYLSELIASYMRGVNNFAGYAGGVIGLFNQAKVTISHSHLIGNIAGVGGAISAQYETTVNIIASTLQDNAASDYGGALYLLVLSTAEVENSVFTANTAVFGGGAMYIETSVCNKTNSIFTNHVGYVGAVLYLVGSTSTSTACSYSNNGIDSTDTSTLTFEGGVLHLTVNSIHYSYNSNYTGNSASLGGVISTTLSTLYSVGDRYTSCSATASGSCIYAIQSSKIILTHAVVSSNTQATQSSGIVYIEEGNFTSTHSIYSHNTISSAGVLNIISSQSDVTNSSFISNRANGIAGEGSGIFYGCSSSVTFCVTNNIYTSTITDSIFTANTVRKGQGGAIHTTNYPGHVLITRSNFTHNSAIFGGAIAVFSTRVNIVQSVFTSNTATTGGGGGIYWDYNKQLPTNIDFSTCTHSGNTASYGNFIATDPVSLNFTEDRANLIQQGEVSGVALSNPINVGLVDFYGQIVNISSPQAMALSTSSSSTVYASVAKNTQGLLKGSGIVATTRGVATFTEVVLIGIPGDNITLDFTAPQTTTYTLSLTIPLRLCIPGEVTQPQGGNLASCIYCTKNTYSLHPTDTSCSACPPHATCPGGSVLDLEKNYWRVNNQSVNILSCQIPNACLGGANVTEQCAVGQTGAYCSVCQTGYSESSNGLCYSCHSSVSLSTQVVSSVMFIIAIVVIGILGKYHQKILLFFNQTMKNRKFRTLRVKSKIIVAFAQIVYQLGPSLNIVYPSNFISYLNYYSIFQLNLLYLPGVGCIVQTNYYDELLISTISPLIVYTAIVIGLHIMVIHAKRMNERNPYYTAQRAQSDTIAAAFVISYVTLISVSTKIFEVFQCETFDDGESYLVADYSVNCNSPLRFSYLTYASIMILVYPIGIPTIYAIVLFRNHDAINPDYRKVIDEKEKAFVSNHVIQKEKIKVRNTYPELKNIKLLFDSYTPKRWYFELFDCARRLMLGAIPVLILRGSSLQIIIVLLVSLVSVAVFMQFNPYIHAHDNELAVLAQWSISLVVISALVIKVQAAGEDNESGLGIVLIVINVFVVAFSIATTLINSQVVDEDDEDDDDEEKSQAGGRKDKEKGGDTGSDLDPDAEKASIDSDDEEDTPALKSSKEEEEGAATAKKPSSSAGEGNRSVLLPVNNKPTKTVVNPLYQSRPNAAAAVPMRSVVAAGAGESKQERKEDDQEEDNDDHPLPSWLAKPKPPPPPSSFSSSSAIAMMPMRSVPQQQQQQAVGVRSKKGNIDIDSDDEL